MTSVVTLIVYAYSSFAAQWGAGPIIATEFQKSCQCQVKLIDIGDGKDLISRLKLEGEKSPADIVLGLDENSLGLLKTELHWNVTPKPYDYGPYAFVYNSKVVVSPPKSLDDLLDAKWKNQIILEDPRLSTTGLGLLLWVIAEKGEDKAWDFFKKLKPQIKVIAPSWDLAYGLFKKEQGQLVFSYWTSPAYHIQEENNHDYKAAAFEKGNYLQKEYVVATPNKNKEKLQQGFIEFVLSEFSQREMAKHNFMYPAVKKTPLPPAFLEIGTVKEIPQIFPNPEKLELWLKKWREIFS